MTIPKYMRYNNIRLVIIIVLRQDIGKGAKKRYCLVNSFLHKVESISNPRFFSDKKRPKFYGGTFSDFLIDGRKQEFRYKIIHSIKE